MKKIVSLFVALCMVFTMIPALAETAVDQAILGTWYLSSMEAKTEEASAMIGLLTSTGMNYTLEINEDGTAKLVVSVLGTEQVTEGTWEAAEKGYVLTMEGEASSFALQDGFLYLNEGDTIWVMSREKKAEDGEAAGLMAMLNEFGAETEGSTEEKGGLDTLLGSVLGSLGQEGAEGEGSLNGLLNNVLGSLGQEGTEGESGLGGLLNNVLGSLGQEGTEGEGSLNGLLNNVLGSLGQEGTEGESGLGGLLNNVLGSLGQEGTEGEGGLSGLLNSVLGSFGTRRGVESEEDQSGFLRNADLEEILSGLFTPIERPENAVYVESLEQFYGTWQLHQVFFGDSAITAEELNLNTLKLTLAENQIDENKNIVMELVDGALVISEDGKTSTVYLTADGELIVGFGMIIGCFTRVAE